MRHQIYIKDTNEDVLQKMQKAGFNITTCGQCSAIKLLSPETDREDITCDVCGFNEEECYFPDLVVVAQ